MAPSTHAPGIARACAECHKRKIKCDVSDDGQSCSNCKLYGSVCQLRARKRRKTNNEPSLARPSEAEDPAVVTLSRKQSIQRQDVHPRLAEVIQSASSSPPAVSAPGTDGNDAFQGAPSNCADELEYSDYYGHHNFFRVKLDGDVKRKPATLMEKDREILRIQNAFDLPPEPLKLALIESFMRHCFPWVPIFDQRWLWDGQESGSAALTQAVLVAGARTSDNALSCHGYYAAAKSLLLCGHETNPIITIVSCLLLGWWNQTSPDIVSFDNSTSWIRQAVGVAYQIDLHKEPRLSRGASYRRRLWWTLVARDSQLCASHGRPRYINLAICRVQSISLVDMADESDDSKVFVAYIRASIMLGDLAETCQQGKITSTKFAELRNALLWWLKDLPKSIKDVEPASESNFNMRQVYMLFAGIVAILYRSVRPTKLPTAIELIASSFIAGLFEDMYKRDELRRLSAGFTFYPLVAAIPLLEALRIEPLQMIVRNDMSVIENTLEGLGQRWPSAHRGLKVLAKTRQASEHDGSVASMHLSPSNDSDLLLFENFDRSKCAMWAALVNAEDADGRTEHVPAPDEAFQQQRDIPFVAIPSGATNEQSTSNVDYGLDPSAAMAYDDLAYWLSDATFDQDIFGGWMLNDDAFGTNLNL